MSDNVSDNQYQKVMFKLEKDSDGYPPDDWESIWAYETSTGQYCVDNIPFFVRGLSLGDIVSVDRKGNELHFKDVISPSGHSVLRVVVFDRSRMKELHDDLAQLGCSTEQSHLPSLLAVDCPPTANLSKVIDFLSKGETNDYWSYEEASIRSPGPGLDDNPTC
ncbi:MAG: DUF4265 domain-containing protein [Pyrinomonadaceae bacterium]